MRRRKYWIWNKATEGMRVFLVDLSDIPLVSKEGIVMNVTQSDRCQMIDGKPVKSTQVASVTIECNDGEKIEVTRANKQYQIILK